MFVDSIRALVDLLEERRVCLYHACQLRDLESYLDISGVPSRKLLEDEGLPFTPYSSDVGDLRNEAWDKVFFNLQDFGRGFAEEGRQKGWVPNVYGPILLVFRPEVLRQCDDVAICLKSAGAEGFERQRDGLSTLEQVDRLFMYDRDHPNANWIKSKARLSEEFSTHTDRAYSTRLMRSCKSGSLRF
jgi:hypothetical protein